MKCKPGHDPLHKRLARWERIAKREGAIFADIAQERERQQVTFKAKSIAGDISMDTKLRILVEEVGEVAQAIDTFLEKPRDEDRRKALKAELVQVAACAVGMLEAL